LYPAPADHPVVARAAVDGVVAAVAEEPVVLCAAADAVVAGEQDRAGVEGIGAVHPRLKRRGRNGEACNREDLGVRWDVGEVAIGIAWSLGFPAGDHPAGQAAGVVIGQVRPMELVRIVVEAEHIEVRRGLQDPSAGDRGRTSEGEDVVGGKPGVVAHRQNGHRVSSGMRTSVIRTRPRRCG